MSTYEIDDLLRRWERGDLAAEQAMAYLLQNVVMLSARLAGAERAIRTLEQELAARKQTRSSPGGAVEGSRREVSAATWASYSLSFPFYNSSIKSIITP